MGLGGFEPPTSPLSGVRSNQLSYRPEPTNVKIGGARRDRTADPLLAKQVLSQLSYGPDLDARFLNLVARKNLWYARTPDDILDGNNCALPNLVSQHAATLQKQRKLCEHTQPSIFQIKSYDSI
jgi:hypothetical protein